jgi:hypothetical protein
MHAAIVRLHTPAMGATGRRVLRLRETSPAFRWTTGRVGLTDNILILHSCRICKLEGLCNTKEIRADAN